MATVAATKGAKRVRDKVVSKQRLYGSESRWRRFGEPTPAGQSLKEDGTPDYGVFGPGTVAWKILLHPATIVFQFSFQQKLQLLYKPIAAGIRDVDPVSRKARSGTLTLFDGFERGQRNSGIHAPMWLGDTATAQRVARHLRNVHTKVEGGVIDVGAPELGGYSANSPREAMWAALTEMHSMLWLYETFAFRDGRAPHPLSAQERDQFVAEVAAYCRLFGSPEEEIPTSMAELEALYVKYDELFQHSDTMHIHPETGLDMQRLLLKVVGKNFHISQLRLFGPVYTLFRRFDDAITGAFPDWARRWMGLSEEKERKALKALKRQLPQIRRMQRPRSERHYMRLMWGPDAVTLIEAARKLQNGVAGPRST